MARGERADVRPGAEPGRLSQVRPRDYLVRFGLGAVISVVAALLAKSVGPRFGGMFLAFPAILPASLTLIQEKEGTRESDRNAIGAVLGGVALAVFAAAAEASLGRVPAPIALLVAMVGWLAVSFALYALLALVRPDLCDRNQD